MASIAVITGDRRGSQLYQWDIGQVLEISGLVGLTDAPEVHFSHERDELAIVQPSTKKGAGTVTVGVPDVLLETADRINVYICVEGDGSSSTIYKLSIIVRTRPKPADYIPDKKVYAYALHDTVMEVVTLEPGAEASVEKVLDGDKLSLRFCIPAGKGDKGDKGDPGEPGVSANDDEMSDLWAALAAMRSGTNYPILASDWQANARDASGYSTMANWRKTVKYVSFVKDYTPSGSEITWTVSAEDSPSTITGYQLGDHVYICTNGCEKIRLVGHINPFMSSLPNLIEVNGLDMLDGLESTKTAGWFSGCTSIKHIDLSMIKVPNVFNTQGMFASCASLETVKLPLGLDKVLVDFAVEKNAMYGMFNNCPNLREIDLGRGLTNVNNEMFHKMYNLESIKGLGSVTTIGDKAFCYTPKLKTDLKPERITSIGASAFRMSGVETYTDFSSVPVDAVGEKATRHVRWSADALKAIQAISVPDVYKTVPNAISQKSIDIVYSTEEDGTTHTVSECGCMSVAYYHVWQALHAGTDKEYPNYESWFNDKLNYDGQWATKNYMTGNGNMPASTNMLLDSLGWTNPNISESNTLGKISAESAEQKQIIVDRLNAGLPTVVNIHSVNITGNHAVAIIGSDSVTDKFAVIDSAVSDTVAVVSWLAYEDIFVFNDSSTTHDGIYPIEYGAES